MSVIFSTLSRSVGSASLTVRALRTTRRLPDGVSIVSRSAIGAAMPQRGSPPTTIVRLVPSGATTTDSPSSVVYEVVVAPPGSVTVRRRMPSGPVSVRYTVVRPSVVATVTMEPPGCGVTVSVELRPSGPRSFFNRPRVSYSNADRPPSGRVNDLSRPPS